MKKSSCLENISIHMNMVIKQSVDLYDIGVPSAKTERFLHEQESSHFIQCDKPPFVRLQTYAYNPVFYCMWSSISVINSHCRNMSPLILVMSTLLWPMKFKGMSNILWLECRGYAEELICFGCPWALFYGLTTSLNGEYQVASYSLKPLIKAGYVH
ncbi:hypothetical protein WISP_34743 [Willisornis vidua]|uniref:Uncharacterized protein n=1 Tax=Willisornis vidua TaxID=1566151 RepID=A0ABQ9DP55_9PASS|nr:hypothetical protein WISP_34743 [Willisornis vidua]